MALLHEGIVAEGSFRKGSRWTETEKGRVLYMVSEALKLPTPGDTNFSPIIEGEGLPWERSGTYTSRARASYGGRRGGV